jgi:hypothetical protein
MELVIKLLDVAMRSRLLYLKHSKVYNRVSFALSPDMQE